MPNLDDLRLVKKIDTSNMRRILAEFPQQLEQAYRLGKDFPATLNSGDIKNIVFCGMGGSAIGAEIISFYLRGEIDLPTYVNRDYTLPRFVDKGNLVIFSSYSGNTEETLSAYQQAKTRGAKIIVLTSGGKLADFAKKDGYPYLLIPAGLPPRAALGFLCFPVLALFSRMRLIEDKEKQAQEAISLLEKMRVESLGIELPGKSNPAKRSALRLFNKFCVIYAAGEHLTAVVTRLRGQLAENSKQLSSSHILPEMNHNEIVGWQNPKNLLRKFTVIILRDKGDHPQVKKRIEISKDILQKERVEVEELWSQGEGLLARTFSLIYLGDYLSYYLALLNKEDPTPVKRIEYLKKRLKQ